jgi:hypothetical protein
MVLVFALIVYLASTLMMLNEALIVILWLRVVLVLFLAAKLPPQRQDPPYVVQVLLGVVLVLVKAFVLLENTVRERAITPTA